MLLLILVAIPGQSGHAADDRAEREKELQQVRQRIEALRGEIDADIEKRDSMTARLRDTERLLGAVRRNLASLRTERESSEARQRALSQQQQQRRAELDSVRDSLAGQLRAAYVNGREERLKLLLSHRDPAVVGRQNIYYRYLTDSRVQQIGQVEQHLAELARIEAEVQAETARLAELERRRSEELASLERGREERREIIAKLGTRIDSGGSQLGQLTRQEQALVNLLEELERALADFPVDSQEPFNTLKGKLAWPVQGEVLGNFGRARSGKSMKWNGVLIGAQRGSPVRAIAHGRVAYADWLPGLGLLTVIEHGDGYLSLYGHNERLDKTAGDWVDAGEVIASVGDSGGQPQPALYFEIRHQRTPVNPHPWFNKRLATSQ
ncbi:MAG: peptidoglycan DD-metalloendopeptidase family protein [Gammaproteobacteria bacterium]|nr:peptidoglycan DD-metalloendopeptidase family protein [Gammaproteobacteria bacterium]NNF60146.1 peptidoglycan DD-metalloendopeptidase family protein [Gammaproteobacteria bacterium]NNM21558.1 peptidoglycan DD-metalloendopeptidase family protein [Gammaproteobacteria bacterium]